MIISSFEELEARLQEKLMELNFDVSIFGDNMENYEKFIKYVHHKIDNPVTAARIILSAMTDLYGLTEEQFEIVHQIYAQKKILGFANYGTLISSNEEGLSYYFKSKFSESVYNIRTTFYRPIEDFTEYTIVSR